MIKIVLACAGVTALVATGAGAAPQGGGAVGKPSASNPLLAAVDRPVRRRAAVRQGQGRALQAGARGGDGRAARRDRRDRRRTRAPPTFENTIAALERAGRDARPRARRSTASAASTMSDARVPGGRARDGAEARRASATRSCRTRSSSRASRRSTRRASKPSLTPEQQRLAWRDYNNFVRAGAKLDADGQEAPVGDQPAAGRRSSRPSARTCSPTRRTTSLVLENEADLAGLPESLRAAAAAAAEARGQKGKWAIPNTRSSHGAVPHLLRPARPAREGLAHVLQPRRQRRRARQQRRSSPRS